jgi:hypothetical protein
MAACLVFPTSIFSITDCEHLVQTAIREYGPKNALQNLQNK